MDSGSCHALVTDLLAASRILSAAQITHHVPGATDPPRHHPAPTGRSEDDTRRLIRAGAVALRALGLALERFANDTRAAQLPPAGDTPPRSRDGRDPGALASQRLRMAQRRLRTTARAITSTLAVAHPGRSDRSDGDTTLDVAPRSAADPTTVFPCGSPTPSSTAHRSTTCSTC